MNEQWSGAFVYEWIEEANNYGLVSYGSSVAATVTGSNIQDGFTRSGSPTRVLPDFTNLQSQWATLTPAGVASSAYALSTITPPACPSSTAGGWLVNGDVALPSVGETQQVSSLASVTATTISTPSGTGSAASATATKKGGASGGKELAGMSAGLVAVMLGFVYWL
jgi:hypothetical protein